MSAALVGSPHLLHAEDFIFTPPALIYFENEQWPSHLAAGDLNQNGNLDIVVAGRNNDGIVQMLFGNGDGTFQPPQELILNGQTDYVLVTDINQNGILDLVFAVRSINGRVAVVFGNGDGTFQDDVDYYPVGRVTQSVEGLDLNGNGLTDLIAGNYSSGTVRPLLNVGNGEFEIQPPTLINEYVAGTIGVQHLRTDDITGDGHNDLIVAALGGGRVSVLPGKGDGTLGPAHAYRLPVLAGGAGAAQMTTTADINGDGAIDIVAPMADLPGSPQKFGVFIGPNAGVFAPPQVFTSSNNGLLWTCAVADFDGDGRPDIVFSTAFFSPRITVVRNLTTSDGLAFGAPIQLPGDSGLFPRALLPIDVNNNGVIDLVSVDFPNHALHVRLNLTPQAFAAAGGEIDSPPAFTRLTLSRRRDGTSRASLPSDLEFEGTTSTNEILQMIEEWGPTP